MRKEIGEFSLLKFSFEIGDDLVMITQAQAYVTPLRKVN